MKQGVRTGLFEGRFPWSVQGFGDVHLVILDGLRPEHEPPQGLGLQGLAETFGELARGRAVWTLGRARGLPEGTSFASLAQDLASVIDELIPQPRVLMGMGMGGGLAVEIAAHRPELTEALVLVSSGPRLSPFGRELYRRLIPLAARRRWGEVHSLLARVMFRSPLSQGLAALAARLFTPDLGAPVDPWDFLVSLQAELEWDGRECCRRVSHPTLVLHGEEDPLYDVQDVREVWEGRAQIEIWPKTPHGLIKVDRDRVLDRIQRFLEPLEPHRWQIREG